MTKSRWVVALSVLLFLSSTACSDSVGEKQMPEYKENKNPERAFRLTMRIDNAPGPLKVMVSASQYDVVNRECLPPPKNNPGGHLSPVPTNDIPFELARISDNEYTGVVYADGMIDEDYHGRGVCRWSLIQAQVQLKATGAENETRFIASLSRNHDEFGSGRPKILHYVRKSYPVHPESKINDFPDFGQSDRSRMAIGLTDDDLFTITLAAMEVVP